MPEAPPLYRRYVALGDSFSEGMCDPAVGGEHPWRGWADRVAEALGTRASQAGRTFDYANLAVRGKLLAAIEAEQVPVALGLEADLYSIVGGPNDALRRGADMDAVADRLDGVVARLRATGADVLMCTTVDPGKAPLIKLARANSAVFAAHIWTIARRHGAKVVDLWGMRSLHHRDMWAEDRIHLTAEGHRRVALHALEVLGVPPGEDWTAPLPPPPPRTVREAWREDSEWVRGHVVPWVGRRLTGRSSGDGLPPKRPVPAPVLPPSAD